MQKVEGSSPFSRSQEKPRSGGVFLCSGGAPTGSGGLRCRSPLSEADCPAMPLVHLRDRVDHEPRPIILR
jgi:hypothetical protein